MKTNELRTITLVRHAKSSWKDSSLDDKERPLKKRGKNDLKLLKPILKKHKVKPDHIFSSSAARTKQTAEIFADIYNLKDKRVSYHDELYHPDPRDIVDFIRHIDNKFRNITIIGHNPELTDAADFLWKDTFMEPVPTSACICLSFDIERWERLKVKTGDLVYYEYPGKYK